MVLGHPALEFLLAINFQNFAYEEGCGNGAACKDIFILESDDIRKQRNSVELVILFCSLTSKAYMICLKF